MYLPRRSREYAIFTFTGLPDPAPTVEAQIGTDPTWYPVTVVGQVGKLLVRGPDHPGPEGVLVSERSEVRVRVLDTPEEIVRSAGVIRLTD